MATLAAEDPSGSLGVSTIAVPALVDSAGESIKARTNASVDKREASEPSAGAEADLNSLRASSGVQEFEFQEPSREVSPRLQSLREAACYLAFYLAGYNGGVTGTLLPAIESAYHLNYTSVSFLFVAYCAGYLISAFGTGVVMRRLGFGKVIVGGGVVQLIGIIINCSQLSSFPLMCIAFLVVGMGYASQLGLCNSYFATLPRPLLRMGALHGIYGFGAFTSPLIASQFIAHAIPINFFYFTSLAICIPTIVLAYFTFVHGKARYDSIPEEQLITAGGVTPGRASMREVLSSVEVWTLAIFLLFYVGAEESIGGWIVSYMLKVRHGSAQGAAWVASGFYLGIALGRVTLPVLNILIGERRVVLMYILIACGLQAVAWTVNSFIGTAVATALVGYTISTFYTAAIHTASKLLPRRMHTTAMGLISSIGQSGSALFPFIIGVISNKKGIWVVQPSVVALLIGQFICWSIVPKVGRRIE